MPAPKNMTCAGQADHFVGLTHAASLVFRSVAGVVTHDPAKLSNIAHTVAGRFPVYSRQSTSEPFVLVPRRDICIGIMEEAGSTLRFADGRPPRRNLSIRREELPRVIEELCKKFGGRPDKVGM